MFMLVCASYLFVTIWMRDDCVDHMFVTAASYIVHSGVNINVNIKSNVYGVDFIFLTSQICYTSCNTENR